MKSLRTVSLVIVLCLGMVTAAIAQIPCPNGAFDPYGGITPPSPGSTMALGPTMYYGLSLSPDIQAAVGNGMFAWNGTDAQGRVTPWNGIVTTNDCPSGLRQMGAFSFSNSSCTAMRANLLPPYTQYLAFADIYWGLGICNGPPACVTGSVVLNADVAWSTNPAPNQFDLQSVVAHEFGHVFGLGHATQYFCEGNSGYSPAPHCTMDPNRNTMGTPLYPGETCERDLSTYDILSINALL